MRGTRGGAAELFQGEIIRRSPKEGGEEHRAKMKGERTTSECRRMSIGVGENRVERMAAVR